MSTVGIESFVSPPEVVHDRMVFKEFWNRHNEESPDDFPMQLEMYHWYVAHMGWTLMNTIPPLRISPGIGVPEALKPFADLECRRGFLVMVGTVAQVLHLSGFHPAATEFVGRAHGLDYDTGHLVMLAYDYVNSTSKIDEPQEDADER
jgi:hypothetical protein